MQYKRLDPSRGLTDHLYELKAQLRANDTAPTGDVGLSGQIVATDPVTGVETIIGRLPDGSTGIRQWVNDITPPGQPSTPTGAPTIGGAIITWDGRDWSGLGQPEDYDRTEIEYSTDGNIWAHGGTLYGANSQTVASLTNGTLYYFRLISYDKNNNASPASASVSVTPVSIVDNADVEGALQTLRDKDTELTTNVQTAQGDASQALQDALTAFNTALGVPTTFYSPTRPPVDPERAFVVGDEWFDTDDNNKLYVWNGTDFILSIDPQGTVDTTLANLGINDAWVADIEAQADRSISTYLGTATPTDPKLGDLWLTGNADSPLKRFNGTVWETFEDPNILAAYQKAVDAQSAADEKIKTYAQATAPTGLVASDVGDLWIDTDNGIVSRWSSTAWVQVVDNGTAAANKALTDLGINQTWVNEIETQADRAIDTFFGTTTPTNMQAGDLWLTGVAGEPMKRFDGTNWVVFEDPNVQSAYQQAIDAQVAANKAIESARSYVNPATSVKGVVVKNGLSPSVVDSDTAMGAKALQKTGDGHGWWEDQAAKQAIDPNLLYRLSIRVRIVTPANDTQGTGLYFGAVGFASNGTTYINNTGADTHSSQQWVFGNVKPRTDGVWEEYVCYYKGISATTPTGSGTVTSPRTFHSLTKIFCPGMILDYNSGNGTWEVSHWAVDAIDDVGHQALIDAGAATNIAKSKIRTFAQSTAPAGMTSENSGDLWINTTVGDINGQVRRWSGSAWILVVESGANSTSAVMNNLGYTSQWRTDIQTQADRAIDTFYGTTTPTGMQTGDLWLTGVAGEPMKRYNGTIWETFEDPNIQAAYARAGEALAEADKKIRTFAQSTAPTGMVAADMGDLWIDTDDGKVHRWSGTAWAQVSDNGASLIPAINAKGKVIIQSAEPAVGDRLAQNLWIDTTVIGDPALPGNIPKRWTGSAWVAVTEKAIVDAANAAANAQEDATQALTDAGLAMTSASQRSRIVHLDTTPVVPEGGWKNGDVWYKHLTTSITSPIVDWYIWNGAWELQTLDESFLPLVDIGAGTYGTLRGNSFAAKSISSEALIVGDFTNLWQNPDFETDTIGEEAKALTPNTNVRVVAGGANGSGKALSLAARSPGNQDVYDNNLIPVKPGDEFYLSAYGKFANTAGTGTGGVGFRMYDANRVHLNWNRVVSFTTKTTTWPTSPTTGSYIIPANVHFVQPWITFSDNGETTNSFQIDDIEIRRKNKGTLIVDGAFDARTITGALIQSTIEANKGIKLSSTQFVAYNDATGTETLRFDGTNSMITGAVYRTSATGARVQIDSTGLKAYGADGTTLTTDLNGSNNLITGRLATNPPGAPGVILIPKTTTGLPGIWFASNGEALGTEAAIYADENWALNIRGKSNAMGSQGPVRIHGGFLSFGNVGGYTSTGDSFPTWTIDSGGSASFKSMSAYIHSGATSAWNITANYLRTAPEGTPGLVLLNTSSGAPGMWFSSNGYLGSSEPAIYADSNFDLHFRGRVAGPAAMRFDTGVRVMNYLDIYDPPTSTFGANVGISSSPKDRIYRLTSAPKYKVNREMIDLASAWNILDVTPSRWFDKNQIEERIGSDSMDLTDPDDPKIDPALLDGLDLRKIPGVSAKDVEAAGLTEFVTYSADGEVEGVSYDRMWILLVPIIRDILTRMSAIDKKPVTPKGPLNPLIDPKNSKNR